MITLAQLLQIMPHSGGKAGAYLDALTAAMARWGINTQARQGMFLAQLAHESGEFRYMQELADGSAYEHREDLGNTRPEAIQIAAAHGSTPGRWWKGHGPIQITGFDNHRECGEALGLDLLNNPLLLTEPDAGCQSAGWYWSTHGCNELADLGKFVEVTRKINGGTNGLASRQAYWAAAQRALPVAISTGAAPAFGGLSDLVPGAPDEPDKPDLGAFNAAEPIISPPAAPAPPERSMPIAALIATFGPMIADLWPVVSKLFSSGSEVAQRNTQTAGLVIDTIIKSANAVNLQDAIDKAKADPALQATVHQAIVTEPTIMQLLEVGGGIEKAREQDLKQQAAAQPFWKTSAVFWISLILLPLVYWLVGSLIVGGIEIPANWPVWAQVPFKMFGGAWNGESRSGGFNLVIGLVLGGICGVYYGVSVTQGKANNAAPEK